MTKVESKPNIIIDNGSGYIKAGFSSEKTEGPRAVFPTIIGYQKHLYSKSLGESDYYVGKDAETKREVLNSSYPIERGIIKNFDDMERIWRYVFTKELKVKPEEHKVLLINIPQKEKKNTEKMVEIMFEKFNVNGLCISIPGYISLCSEGKFEGFSVDLGEGVSKFIPIWEGYILPPVVYQNFGGKDLTEYLDKELLKVGYSFYTISSKIIANKIKEKVCYVALDYKEELQYVEKFDYELPDGHHVIIDDQRIKCPEILFKSDMIKNIKLENSISNIVEVCYNSIQKCDIDLRKELYNCIALSGGTSMFNGLKERFTKEIKALAPESMKEEIKVIGNPERKFAAWIGGSIMSSISTFESTCITKTEYEESGAIIISNRFNI